MTTAFLFPGQGSDVVRCLPEWEACSAAVRRLLEVAARQAGVSADTFVKHGSRGLERTELLEPATTALCLGIHEELDHCGVRPDVVAGHSLGEVAATAAAGCCGPEEAIALAAERGRLMARQARRHPGGMAAITVAGPDATASAEALAAGEEGIALAAYNSPEQWVVAGSRRALATIPARFDPRPVQVAGPWHSAAMADAVEELRAAARRAITGSLGIPMVCNRTGAAVRRAENLPDLLAEQLTHPVRWAETMIALHGLGVTDYVTVGPGKVLRALAHANLGFDVNVRGVETPSQLERIREAMTR